MKTVPGPANRVVVVGAGLAGLAAALHLAGRGREVTVLERDPGPGGRAGRVERHGYQLDTGPTVLTMPSILSDTFAAVGAELTSELPLARLDPAYVARFADGSTLPVHTDAAAMADAVRDFAGPAEAAGYTRLREWLTRLYQAEFGRFIDANIDSPLGMLRPELARLVALGGFRRLDGRVGRFLSDERLKRVFTFQALYAGESPMRALALYAVISYMDTVGGVYFPPGGIAALPQALARVAADAGVKFGYGDAVGELERAGSRVTAVRTASGARYPCDAVVLTTELPESYRLLGRPPRRPVPLRAAPSALVVHAGGPGTHPEVAHHTISFGHGWRSTFDELISQGRRMSDPSLLITRPTASDPGLAPPGRQLYSVLAPVPNLDRGPADWATETDAYAEEVLDVARARLLPGFEPEFTHVIGPAEWADRGLVAGTPFSYAHSFGQTGPFRPRNLPRGTDNVVLAGGATVPGVGVPTVLISGRLAADRITGGTR
ncbi:phytoene dehydrogenase-related protein [Amycolatopsis mediterranei S699]|uniref:Phytoene dehydrogenase-related protein n=3 Tax=Amycolatopsis mediterranei TaxID=33910 RepID=A0A0H3D695_AMYMU|nr:phytoene desaturase family protein [Amycolatopsis mediterranei]ADJ45852.1 phytoene dehydrogenase-related protein [Amycolatopsis mediterranei U32]AEK42633.1 phytoene dehydrogenase-related protein [Amycolatopsis mediterranei S699]AFO77563.1 phytoene dehydrogenase-related protein [Amycolatopsis mediterranei S699]AGT84691.1 phytoene dehydrogenase-related protein [Amycolatopsis mediterranei RB]KDO05387.1 phytoene dehydrogenase [Amycolatopsis mediterranei]